MVSAFEHPGIAPWIRPTSRATPFQPLLGVTLALVTLGAIVGARTNQAPTELVVAAYGAIAAGVVLGLDDEAKVMTRSLPATAIARLFHRLLLLGSAAVAASALLLSADRLFFDQPAATPPAVAILALTSTSIAIEVWLARRRPDAAADAAAVSVMVWALSATLLPDLVVVRSISLQSISEAWIDRSWWVLATSSVLTVLGTTGREA